jgi:ADP-ribosylglycohydrolase
MKATTKELITTLLFAMAAGEALCLPFEFSMPDDLLTESFDFMIEYRHQNQPTGAFSDDSALTFCSVEGHCTNLSQKKTANLLLLWMAEGYWTANGAAFDIARTAVEAPENIEDRAPVSEAAPKHDQSCAFWIDMDAYSTSVCHSRAGRMGDG